MPFLRGDFSEFGKFAAAARKATKGGEVDSWEFRYYPSKAKFDWKTLGPVANVMRDLLLGAGAKLIHVSYDGGFDEGFAHVESITFDDGQQSADDVAKALATSALIKKLREAASKEKYDNSEFYVQAEKLVAFTSALNDIAFHLAICLLGGYGTGAYEIYGELVADLKTGTITDRPDAPKSSKMD